MYYKNWNFARELWQFNRALRPQLVLMLAAMVGLTACQPVQPVSAMKSEKTSETTRTAEELANQAVVQRLYEEVLTQKHLDVIDEVFDVNVVDHSGGPNGVEGSRALISGMLTALPDFEATADMWVLEGDLVASRVTLTATHQAEFMGVAATGNPVTWSHIDIQRVQNGKITDVWHNIPITDILHQMQSGPNIEPSTGRDPSATEADLIRSIERKRLKAMVDADMEVAMPLHSDDFQLINPGGGALSKEEYLGLLTSGDVDYLVWEPISEIEVRLYGPTTGVIRYQSQTDIVVFGEKSSIQNWHTDLYEKRDGHWQVVWSQATTIQ